MAVPEGCSTVCPYLIVNDAVRLIEWLEATFGARRHELVKRPDGKLLHGAVHIGESMIMFSDARPDVPAMSSMLHVYVDNVDETYRRGLEGGAESLREPQDQFYGDRAAGLLFEGCQWWIAQPTAAASTSGPSASS